MAFSCFWLVVVLLQLKQAIPELAATPLLSSSFIPYLHTYHVENNSSRKVVLAVPMQITSIEGHIEGNSFDVSEGKDPFPEIELLSSSMALDSTQRKLFRNTVRYRLDHHGNTWQYKYFILMVETLDLLALPDLVTCAIGHAPSARLVIVTNGFAMCTIEQERIASLVHKSGGDGASTTFLAFRHEFVGYAVALNAAMLEVPENSFVAVLPPTARLRPRSKSRPVDIFVVYGRLLRQLAMDGSGGGGGGDGRSGGGGGGDCLVVSSAVPDDDADADAAADVNKYTSRIHPSSWSRLAPIPGGGGGGDGSTRWWRQY